MKTAFKLAFCILGAVIGAGFATGREISSFFARFGYKSIWGIVLTSFLFGMYVYFVMQKIREEKIPSPFKYLECISNKPFACVSMAITYIFLLVSFSVMITGSSEILEEYFLISHFWASLSVCMICIVVFIFGKDGVVSAASFLTPVMMIGILWLGIISVKDVPVFFSFDNYITSSIVYVSYNTLGLLTLISSLSSYCRTKREVKLTSVILTLSIFVLMVSLWYVLVKSDPMYMQYNMPIVKITKKYGVFFEKFYIIVLFFAMLTTAFSSGIGLLDMMDKKIKNTNNTVNSVVICAVALIFSYIGFARFIDVVYPILGYLGLSVFLLIFLDILRKIKKNIKMNRK